MGREAAFRDLLFSIVSLEVQRHPSPIALMDVLYIKYREGGIEQEKSVASYKNNISRALTPTHGPRVLSRPAHHPGTAGRHGTKATFTASCLPLFIATSRASRHWSSLNLCVTSRPRSALPSAWRRSARSKLCDRSPANSSSW